MEREKEGTDEGEREGKGGRGTRGVGEMSLGGGNEKGRGERENIRVGLGTGV